MTIDERPRGFLAAFFATLALIGLGIVATNVIVDPFWRFDLVSIRGFNAQRPVFSSYARMGKAGVDCRIRPAQVALGTSRAEVGIDPSYPAWNSVAGPVYNFALAGLGLKELTMMFTHAVSVSPNLKRATIGLDFLMFNANREAVVFGTEVLDFDPERLLKGPSDSCLRSLLYDADSFLGITGLFYSFKTVMEQRSDRDTTNFDNAMAWLSLYNKDGFRDQFDTLSNLIPIRGSRGLFLDAQEVAYVGHVWRPAPDKRYCFARPGQPDTTQVFRDFVDDIYRSGVDVRLYLEPMHARMMLALQDAGLWPQFEDWKRGVVAILDEEARKLGKPPLPLFDFSGFNSVTDDVIPPPDDRSRKVKFFWEPSHYKKAAGDLILDRILGYAPPDHHLPDDFGTKLSPANIEDWLIQTRVAGQQYRAVEPEEAAIVKGAVDRAMEDGEGSNCGAYMPLLTEAANDLRRGDQAGAETAIARATTIDEKGRQRADHEGVAYREPFAATLRIVRAGGRIEPRLSGWVAYQERGQKRAAEGDNKGAADDFEQAIRMIEQTPNPALYFLRGNALFAISDNAEAAKMFEIGLSQDPTNESLKGLLQQTKARMTAGQSNDWVAYQEQGQKRAAEGDNKGAADDFAQAIRLIGATPNPALYFLCGNALIAISDDAGASKMFETGLSQDPTNETLKGLLQQTQARMAARQPTVH
jgi:tetratricopeptide (TPR) repeat protein